MRNIIFGTVAGLLLGSIVALAYDHYMGDGSQLADLQAQLDAANTKLAKAEADQKFLKEQYNSETEQLNQVLANKQQPDASGASPAASPAATPLTVGGIQVTPDMVRGFMAMMSRGGPGGGFRTPQQRIFLLQNRLKLDPDQAKAIKAAMDADEAARREVFREARQNRQPPDPAALAAADTLDKTLDSVLTPSQQVQYQQVQADEKQARAEISATQQVDNMMPLLQLSDDQKGKLMNSLYQQQLSAPDAGSMATNPNPLGALAQQGQAVDSAMKNVLSPDQYALYQQNQQVQGQAMNNFGFGGRRGNNNGGNGGGAGGNGSGPGQQVPGSVAAANAPAPATPPTTPTDTTTPSSGTTTGTTTDSSSTTNTPSATTNAAPVTPPAN